MLYYGEPSDSAWRAILKRNVGIDLAPLWAGVICVFPAAFDVFIRCARSAPLSFDFRFAGSEPLRDYAAQNIENVQCIVDFGRANGAFWIEKLAGRNLPRLHELELILDDTRELFMNDVKQPEDLLQAPALQHLTLSHGLLFPFSSPLLTTLSLSAPDISRRRGIMPINKFLDLLCSMPLLSSIHLTHVFAYAEPTEQLADESVSLPRLTSFYYAGHEDQFTELWRRMVAPLNISLTVRLRKPRRNNMNAIVRSISDHIHNALFDTLLLTDIDYWQYDTAVTLAREASDVPQVSIQPYHRNGIDESKPDHVCSLLKRIIPHLHSPEAIRSIHFQSAFRYEDNRIARAQNESRVLEALRQFPAVTQVHIKQMDVQIMAVLGATEDGLLFPALHTLTMTFKGEEWGWTAGALHGTWSSLLSALEARKEGGRRLPRLILIGTRPTEPLLVKDDEEWAAKARAQVEALQDERVPYYVVARSTGTSSGLLGTRSK
ncbi:hypothetical protein PENSPDRAFT_738132 [Peniophora sp. CONT]|nr:hypothetical protein PENSPDRAFT_738132 [Peniophora sp. CONT]